MTHEVIEIEKKDASRVHILTGIVTDTGSGVVDVNIDNHGVVSSIPVFYHCPDSETADGNPFSTDDRVIIVNSGDADNPGIANMKVIGFEDGLPRECGWKEEWGATFCENHDWNYGNCSGNYSLCPNLPQVDNLIDFYDCGLSLTEEVLINSSERYYLHGGSLFTDLYWEESGGDPGPNTGVLKIKISIASSTLNHIDDRITLLIYDESWNEAKFVFAQGTGADDPDYVGDNSGAEMSFTLADYGLSGSVVFIELYTELNAQNGVSHYSLDYIKII